MKLFHSIDNIMSFIFGVLLALVFWFSFKPGYIVVKNKHIKSTE